MEQAEQIKPIYSDISIYILDKAKIEFLLSECHKLRAKKGLMDKPDAYVLIQTLRMYRDYQARTLKNKAKDELKREIRKARREAKARVIAENTPKKAQKDVIPTTKQPRRVISGWLICQ